MPATDLTWDDIEFDDEFDNFVGRADKLAAFKDNFTGERPKWMVLSITGEGGVGKSTLLKLIAAIERPTSGHVMVNGQNLGRMRRATLPYFRRNIGLIFQDHKLLYDRNVYDNVLLPLHIQGVTGADAQRRVRAALDKVGLLKKERARPITLSGGEQQRLCIARAIVSRPALVIADEPTGNLDDTYARDIMDMFVAFNQVKVTLVISTHDHDLIERYGGRCLTLDAGKVSE